MNNEIKKAADTLKAGGVLLFPADTGWGFGCDVASQTAITRMKKILPERKPNDFVLLIDNPALLDRYVKEVPEVAWDLMELSSTPLTVIFSGSKNISPNLAGEGDTIQIRIPNDDFTRQLLQRFRRPVLYTPIGIKNNENSSSPGFIPEDMVGQADYKIVIPYVEVITTRPAAVIKLWPDGKMNIIRK